MIQLAAFADEIDPDIDVQIEHSLLNGITHFELRSVDQVNVLDLTSSQRSLIRSKLHDAGLAVGIIGSPIGKSPIDQPWTEHFDRFKIAVDAAEFFGASLIRVFSYYPPGGEGKGPIEPHFEEIARRFRAKLDHLQDRPITLVHENEKGIFGDLGSRCLRLMTAIDSPKLRTAFDFANFVQVKERPMDNWPLLKPYTVHIHVKDALMRDGSVVPAGQGDGDVEAILRDAISSGYSGFLSLEPHLKVAGHSHGETGPELFKTAADALKKILARIGVPIGGQ